MLRSIGRMTWPVRARDDNLDLEAANFGIIVDSHVRENEREADRSRPSRRLQRSTARLESCFPPRCALNFNYTSRMNA